MAFKADDILYGFHSNNNPELPTPGSQFQLSNLGSAIQYEINHDFDYKLKPAFVSIEDELKDIKKLLKILAEPDKEMLKQYATLADLYNQYRETYIIIFGADVE